MKRSAFASLNERIIACERCPRLVGHCRTVALEKRAAYRDETYHGKPVPNFGPGAKARMLVTGLAPGAHGANRTGRMFTGDRSGDFLYRAMHDAGFANQPTSTDAADGLQLNDAVITAAAHCAPPGNKPLPQELANCASYLDDLFDMMQQIRVVVCLGAIAFEAVLRLYQRRGWIDRLAPYKFGHAVEYVFAPVKRMMPPIILCSYHPSQQNTFTGRLTPDMMRRVFERANEIIG